VECFLVRFHHFRTEYCTLAPELTSPPPALSWVLVNSEDGKDLGQVIQVTEWDEPTGLIVKIAEPGELEHCKENIQKSADALAQFRQMVQEFELPMKVVDSHYWWDRHKIVFYFTAEERLNFRSLHKAISQNLGIRVVIKQLGIRDYTRTTGGFGPCGRALCCASFLNELKPITLRMARQQNLYVSPIKITGVCGKLLCCLGFEEAIYQEALERFPKIGSWVKTDLGSGRVIGIDIFNNKLIVRVGKDEEIFIGLDDLKFQEEE
jgi:cell fate regulator YaaT (PSP1 superfamily)